MLNCGKRLKILTFISKKTRKIRTRGVIDINVKGYFKENFSKVFFPSENQFSWLLLWSRRWYKRNVSFDFFLHRPTPAMPGLNKTWSMCGMKKRFLMHRGFTFPCWRRAFFASVERVFLNKNFYAQSSFLKPVFKIF